MHKGLVHEAEVSQLHQLWQRYQDDLARPWYEKKPLFEDKDFSTFRKVTQRVVDAMVAEYKTPMILDQATISNTNHLGHPPHADNVQFDSVWWNGKRIRQQDEVIAAQEGAYVLWRMEKTAYRFYGSSIALVSPTSYEGGEVQFFEKWGEKDPIESYKCETGCGVTFCGCQRNIHAVTGVKSGFRLVLLVWTRPPDVRVPDQQTHVCYFRPGTGLGVWLTTADMQQMCGKRNRGAMETWVPVESDTSYGPRCDCPKCATERAKLSWRDRGSLSLPHCPNSQGSVCCGPAHQRKELPNVVSEVDIKQLHKLWEKYQDDLTWPWYDKKPTFDDHEFSTFKAISQKVVEQMAKACGIPMVLDQSTISCTNHHGHPPHADNVQFDSVWWSGRQIKQTDELVASRGGAEVLWKQAKTCYRSYSASIALTAPSEYTGGDLEFFDRWGDKEPCVKYRNNPGDGVAFCGCQRSIHAVTGVKKGFRLVLLVWTRPPEVEVPSSQLDVCYFRPGTGLGVWLTTADLQQYPQRMGKRQKRSPSEGSSRNEKRSSPWQSWHSSDEGEGKWDDDWWRESSEKSWSSGWKDEWKSWRGQWKEKGH